MNRQTVLDAAESDFQSLIGIREIQDFEAKQEWPDLRTATARWEFAKDVAAMANGGGGIVLYGLATQQLPAEQADAVSAVHPVAPGSLNVGMAINILEQHVSPNLRELRIDLVPGRTCTPNGIVLLEVPPQNGKVILCKAMEGTEPMKEYLFGFAERDRDGTRNWTREEVSRMIRLGTTETSVRLESIESILIAIRAGLAAAPAAPAEANDLFNARLDEVLRDE